jgi:hypothetical protein
MLSGEGLEKNKSFKPFSSLIAETRFGVDGFLYTSLRFGDNNEVTNYQV